MKTKEGMGTQEEGMYSVYGCGHAQSIFFLPSFLRHKEAELAQTGVVKGLWGRLMGKGKIPGPDSSSLCLQEAKSCTHQTSPSGLEAVWFCLLQGNNGLQLPREYPVKVLDTPNLT